MAIAQDNGYPSVDAMIPGIAAFEDEVGMDESHSSVADIHCQLCGVRTCALCMSTQELDLPVDFQCRSSTR
jgi:hypothetical protein